MAKCHGEVVKVVTRTTANLLEEFDGEVVDVVLEQNTYNDDASSQFHITMKPTSVEVKGKTGLLHEWIRMSPKSTEEVVPEGSVLDKYLTQVEMIVSEAKKAKTLTEAFKCIVGKKFTFKKVKLGRSFEGHSAREYWTPTVLLK